jgi:glycosyltransferase involved in cell wall biosynthesis
VKTAIRIFWLHPRLREYRKPFFSLMNSDYQITFFFQQSSDVEHDFHAVVSRRNRIAGFEPWTMSWKDVLILRDHIRRSDVVISSFIGNCYTYLSLAFARVYRKPVIVWEECMRLTHAKLRYAVREAICRRLLPHIDCIYTLGPRQEAFYLGQGYPAERIFRANEYPGHVFSALEPRLCDVPVGADRRVVLYLGRLVAKKGVEYLIEAFPAVARRHENAVLLIVGAGPKERELKALAERLDRTRVHFLGSIQDARQRPFLYQRASVVAIPSIETSGLADPGPLVTLEALSAGTPTVVSDAVGNSHHITNGLSGYIVPQQNAAELADAICRCLAGNIGTRREILDAFARIPGFAFQKQKMDEAIAKALAE